MFWKRRSDPSDRDGNGLTVELSGRIVPVRLVRHARARHVRLRADPVRGEVRVTLPNSLPESHARRFVEGHREWLEQRMRAAVPAIPFEDGAGFGFCGHNVHIDWSHKYRRTPVLEEGLLKLGGPPEGIALRVENWLKSEARRILADDLRYYCGTAEVAEPRLSLGDARSRWGSCSRRKDSTHIRLSWRLVLAPPQVRRSVVAHEVAHLRHLNHSKAFYALLDRLFEGNRSKCDDWLREHGPGLHMIGRTA